VCATPAALSAAARDAERQGERRDQEIERRRDPHRAREPDRGQQREAARDRARDRAERVHGVEAREFLAHALAAEVTDQHRQRGPHERVGGSSSTNRIAKRASAKPALSGAERAVERTHHGSIPCSTGSDASPSTPTPHSSQA
jgi:hypothetical protein